MTLGPNNNPRSCIGIGVSYEYSDQNKDNDKVPNSFLMHCNSGHIYMNGGPRQFIEQTDKAVV